MSAAKHTQKELDDAFTAFCAEQGFVMDSANDRADHNARGHLHSDPGSDVNDVEGVMQ